MLPPTAPMSSATPSVQNFLGSRGVEERKTSHDFETPFPEEGETETPEALEAADEPKALQLPSVQDIARLCPWYDESFWRDDPVTNEQLKIFSSNYTPGWTIPIPRQINEGQFIDMILACKKQGISDLTIRGDDYLRGIVNGGWQILSKDRISAMQIEAIAAIIDSKTAPTDLKKGNDIDCRYTPNQTEGGQESGGDSRNFFTERKMFRFRVNMTPIRNPTNDSLTAEATIRTLPSLPPTPDEFGLEREYYDRFHQREGLGLITGGTGRGKSSLLYSIMRGMVIEGKTAPYGHKIVDLASPIEYVINDCDSKTFISQTEIGTMLRDMENATESRNWAYAGRGAMRRAPNVINIQEIRDKPTAEVFIMGANTGHYTTGTQHNNSCASAVQRFLRFFSFEERLGLGSDFFDFLHSVCNQDLVLGRDGKTRYALREYFFVTPAFRDRILTETNVERWPGMVHQELMDQSQKPRSKRSIVCQTKYEHALRRYRAGEVSENVVIAMQKHYAALPQTLTSIGAQASVVSMKEIHEADKSCMQDEDAR